MKTTVFDLAPVLVSVKDIWNRPGLLYSSFGTNAVRFWGLPYVVCNFPSPHTIIVVFVAFSVFVQIAACPSGKTLSGSDEDLH